MSPVEAIFVLFPPKNGDKYAISPPPPIVTGLYYVIKSGFVPMIVTLMKEYVGRKVIGLSFWVIFFFFFLLQRFLVLVRHFFLLPIPPIYVLPFQVLFYG